MTTNLIMSVQANGENIIIGSNEQVNAKIKEIVHDLYQKRQLVTINPAIVDLLDKREILISSNQPYFKVRIDSDGYVVVIGMNSLEEVIKEISLTLSEI